MRSASDHRKLVRTALLGALLSAVLSGGAGAQTTPVPATEAEAAAINMRLAATLCLQSRRVPGQLAQSFEAAGFTVAPWLDAGTFEATAPGVYAVLDATQDQQGACNIQSQLVDLPTARVIADAITAGQNGWVAGGPADQIGAPPGPCQGLTNWDARPVLVISFAAAGNSGECIEDGTSSIVIN